MYTRKKIIITCSVLLAGLVVWFGATNGMEMVKNYRRDIKEQYIKTNLDDKSKDRILKEVADLETNIKLGDKKGSPNFAQQYLQMGIDFETLGLMPNAIDAYKRAEKEDPKSFVPKANLATAYLALNNYNSAERFYREAIEIDPTEFSNYAKLSELYWYKLKDEERARGTYLEGIIRTNNNMSLLKAYASFLERTNRPYEAYLYWQAIAKQLPQDSAVQQRVKELIIYDPLKKTDVKQPTQDSKIPTTNLKKTKKPASSKK